MIGTFNVCTKVLKLIKTYVFGWDVTDLRNESNVVIRYLRKRYDEFAVLMMLAGISAVFNLILGLFCGQIGQIISYIDLLMSILSAYLLVSENRGLFP